MHEPAKPTLFTGVRGETVRKGSEEFAVYPYKAPQWHFSTHFGLLMPPKSTLRVLLAPLFGQSRKGNSRKLDFLFTAFYEVRIASAQHP